MVIIIIVIMISLSITQSHLHHTSLVLQITLEKLTLKCHLFKTDTSRLIWSSSCLPTLAINDISLNS